MQRVAFHVEEQVAGVGPGQAGEPMAVIRRDQLDFVLAGLPLLELQGRLGTEPGEYARVQVRDARFRGRFRQGGEGFDARRLELVRLGPLDVGHQAKVVVLLPPEAQALLPMAFRAVGAGLRIRSGRRSLGELLQAASGLSDVGREVADVKARLRAVAEGQPDLLRDQPLAFAEQVGIDAELDEVSGLRLAGQFRVGRLVAVRPQGGRPVRLHQEVGQPLPFVAGQCRLVDHVRAAAERIVGQADAVFERSSRYLRDCLARFSQRL